MTNEKNIAKAPRWVATEAGQWAWIELDAWRSTAANTFAVAERQALLHEAEQLRQQATLVAQPSRAEPSALVEQPVQPEQRATKLVVVS